MKVRTNYIILLILFTILVPLTKVSAINVQSFNELKNQIQNGATDITITSNFEFNASITIQNHVKINGNNKTITRSSNYLNKMFNIESGATLEISNIKINGSAPNWEFDIDNLFYNGPEESSRVTIPSKNYDDDIVSEESLIYNSGTINLKNVTIKDILSKTDGGLINGSGNISIEESNFAHIGTKANGGVLYLTGGTTTITHSRFEKNGTGVISEATTYGGVINSTNLEKLTIEDVEFIDNLGQVNGGVLNISAHDTIIKDSLFRHNQVGNDGSSIAFGGNEQKKILIDNSIFEDNAGLAKKSQSLGTIVFSRWKSTEEDPILIKNSIFRRNDAAAGGVIADFVEGHPYLVLDNCELYNNTANSGGAFYGQGLIYDVRNSYLHDNTADGGGGVIFIYSYSTAFFKNSKLYNNKGKTGGAISLFSGSVTIEDSELKNNSAPTGGGIYVNAKTVNKIAIQINNSLITENKSSIGGGIMMVDTINKIGVELQIHNNSKIYNNSASVAGDDIAYLTSVSDEERYLMTLNDPKLMNIPSIDGWYNDKTRVRYIDTENPEKFNDYINYQGASFFLKAGGITTLDYELLGGKNENIKPLTLKYGIPYVIDDKIPVKENYEFIGWNTKEDGSGSWYHTNDTYDGSEGLILYAQYKSLAVSKEEEKKEDNSKSQEKEPIINPNTIDIIQIIIFVLILTILMIIGKKYIGRYNKYGR